MRRDRKVTPKNVPGNCARSDRHPLPYKRTQQDDEYEYISTSIMIKIILLSRLPFLVEIYIAHALI